MNVSAIPIYPPIHPVLIGPERGWPMLIVKREISAYGIRNMSYTGKVKNGVVVLPAGVKLPEGAEVEVVPRESPDVDPFLEAVKQTAKSRPHWPEDYALNHGHYVGGEPRKS